MTEHQHEWRTHTHIDGCHWHVAVFVCECGDVETRTYERDFHAPDDVYSAVFMVDGCDRCQALWLGAKPKVTA